MSQCHFVNHKFNIDWPGNEPGPSFYRPVMNCLSHGMAQGVVPDQNQMYVIYVSRYNRQSGFFVVVVVMFNSTSARLDFNGAVQWCNTAKPAYNRTTMDQSFGFML